MPPPFTSFGAPCTRPALPPNRCTVPNYRILGSKPAANQASTWLAHASSRINTLLKPLACESSAQPRRQCNAFRRTVLRNKSTVRHGHSSKLSKHRHHWGVISFLVDRRLFRRGHVDGARACARVRVTSRRRGGRRAAIGERAVRCCCLCWNGSGWRVCCSVRRDEVLRLQRRHAACVYASQRATQGLTCYHRVAEAQQRCCTTRRPRCQNTRSIAVCVGRTAC